MRQRHVLHVDLDQFIAAVEVLRRPELRGKPVVVGGHGDPTARGVVSTASYEAREFGVRSGMPLRTALKRCPEAVFLPVDADAYLEVSRDVMDSLRTFPAVVEVAGWDEAFLEVETDDPEAMAREIQRAVRERTQLECTVGIGESKLQSKIAAGFGKPAGVFRLTSATWREVMGGLPTDALWGVGRKTARRLAELGIRTVDDLASADVEELAGVFGAKTGPWLRRVALGQGGSHVSAEPYRARSHGREVTFQEDVADPAEIRREVVDAAHRVAGELPGEGRRGARVVVKVRFAPFVTHTHGVALPAPTMDPGAIEHAAIEALERFELDRPVRLIGVRVELEPPAEA